MGVFIRMKEIHLTGIYGEGKVAIIDDEDFDMVNSFNWHVVNNYPVKSLGQRPNRKKISMHRFVLGYIPEGKLVDHINGDTLDNRKVNLRICTNAQNQMNAKKQDINNASSIYKGVIKHKPWRASIANTTIGYFDTEIEAAQAYDTKAVELYGDFAKLNFPGNLKI